ncbi:MAG: shikimate kinase [Verrucomicrobiales bacterium]|jgi:shikimate kinase
MGSKDRETPRNVILIGYMGTGKTSVGRRIADSLGFKFVDTDELIEQKAGEPIPAIFEIRGETSFRDLETEALRSAAAGQDLVISTGGGIVLREENREIIADAGYCIWLKAGAEAIFERVSGNENRPLLRTENPRATIDKMLTEREPLYEATADFVVTTDGLNIDEVTYGICESVRVHFSHESGCAAGS